MSELIGQELSKVEIQKLIGRGGMAEVYLGRHITLNRPVAVKVLQAHLSDDSTLLGRFTSEAQAIATMRHPNIVQVFDFDVANDRPYMVMELLEGPSLKDLLSTLHANQQALPAKAIARLISALASALDYAHARGIVHRDVKPANIMLRRASGKIDPAAPLPPDVEPVLTDFGVARIADAASQTVSGTIIGTPAYMSPEQIRGEPVDARSDIYSLGVILYEMLAGKVPFAGDTQASVLMKHVSEPVPPLPSDFLDLQPIVDRVLAKEPAQRLQKATDLASVLQAALGLSVETGVTEPRLREVLASGPEADYGTGTIQVGPPTRSDVGPHAGATAIQSPAAGRFNPLWAVAGIGGAALVVGLILLGVTLGGGGGQAVLSVSPVATEPSASGTEAAQPSTEATAGSAVVGPVGLAVFNDAALSVSLRGLPPPADGAAYHGWLIDPENPPLPLGALATQDGEASLSFSSPDEKKLLLTYSGFALSEEPAGSSPAEPSKIVFEGVIDPAMIQRLRHLDEISGGAPFKTAILNGLRTQNDIYNSHLNFATGAVIVEDLPDAKAHAEHLININVGLESADYVDWNGNKRVDNPGDDVGLIPYLLMVKDAARGAAEDPSAPADAAQIADTVALAVDSLTPTLANANRIARQLVSADEIDASTKLLADELGGLQTKNAVALLRQEADKLPLAFAVEIVAVTP